MEMRVDGLRHAIDDLERRMLEAEMADNLYELDALEEESATAWTVLAETERKLAEGMALRWKA